MNLSTTNEELEIYLRKMRNILNNPKGKLKIKNERDKNFLFKYLYTITDKKVKDVLISLVPSDFYMKVESKNEYHKGDILYIWNPIRVFSNSICEEREIEMYIKTFLDDKNKLLVVISFHEFNDFS